MKRLLIIAACTQLSGCFFIFIPGSVTSAIADSITGAKGAYCVATSVKPGDRININGQQGTVLSVSGTSSRCVQPNTPIRADVGF